MSVGTETERYNSVLEITVSFLGIHNWEPDIFIRFSAALHLQCAAECMAGKYLTLSAASCHSQPDH